MKNHQFLISRRSGTLLAIILLALCIGVSIYLITERSAYSILWVTVPLSAFAVFFLKANDRVRAKVDEVYESVREIEFLAWVVLLLIGGVVIVIAVGFGLEWPGKFIIESIRFLTGSE